MKHIAVITGAGSGLGAEFAVEYVRRYAAAQACDEVWLVGRRADALARTATGIRKLGSKIPQVKTLPFDIGGAAGFSAFKQLLSEQSAAAPFTIVLLVNNAGFGIYGAFASTFPDEVLQMIDVNVYALTGFCAAALPFMQKGSYIVNVASMAAFLPVGNFAVYAAAKSYVLSFSLSLRAELCDRGIGVTAVCPGQTATEFARRAVHNSSAVMPQGAKDPYKVAAHALRCTFKNRPFALFGISWKLQAFASRFIGKGFFAWFTFKFVKRIPDSVR
ncbi:MAG: SDR family NAD(P)-dependent oxidoreductase [Treponema sp.]